MESNILIQIKLVNAKHSEIIWNNIQAACTSDTPIEKAGEGECATGNCQEKHLDDQNIMLNKNSSNFIETQEYLWSGQQRQCVLLSNLRPDHPVPCLRAHSVPMERSVAVENATQGEKTLKISFLTVYQIL